MELMEEQQQQQQQKKMDDNPALSTPFWRWWSWMEIDQCQKLIEKRKK